MKVAEEKKRIITNLLIIIIGFLFFLIGGTHTIMFKDSATFIRWSQMLMKDRNLYVVYPELIRICRLVCGEESYIGSIWIIQSFVAFCSVFALTHRVCKEYEFGSVQKILCFVFLLSPYTFTLPEAVATHYIFTEGLSISLFYFSWILILRLLKRMKVLDSVMLLLLDILMFLTRPQLIVFLPISGMIILYSYLNKHIFGVHRIRWCLFNLLSLAVVLLAVHFAYNVISSNIYDRTRVNQLMDSLSGKAVTTIGPETAEYFEGADSEIVAALYDQMTEEGTTMSDFPDSILDYEKMHVIINSNTRDSDEVMWDYYRSHNMTNNEEDYRSKGRIISGLMDNNREKMYMISLMLMPSSLVASIFMQPASVRLLCYVISAAMYVVAGIVILFLLFGDIDVKYRYPFSSVLFTIVANALFCNLILYGQQRYVIYCMGMFYVSLMIALTGLYRNIKSRKVSESNESV